MKTVTLDQFLTETEINRAAEIYRAWPGHVHAIGESYAKTVCAEIIQPNMERINKALGQENDAMYLAYAVEFAMMEASRP